MAHLILDRNRIGWAAIATLAVLLLFTVSSAQAAEQAISLKGGLTKWDDPSNSDELESAAEDGYVFGLAYDRTYALAERNYLGTVRLEIEALIAIEEIHGVNPNGMKGRTENETVYVTTLMANVWPEFIRFGRVSLYGGGGIGIGMLKALGDSAFSHAWQAGGGLMIGVTESLSLDLGYRYLSMGDTRVDNIEAEYDRHTALVGLRWSF